MRRRKKTASGVEIIPRHNFHPHGDGHPENKIKNNFSKRSHSTGNERYL